MEKNMQKKKKDKWDRIMIWVTVIAIAVIALVCYLLSLPLPTWEFPVEEVVTEQAETEKQSEKESETENVPNLVPLPEIDEQLLTINDYSRPGDKVDAIEKVVIHYLANPNTSAQQNHDYFESLKDLKDISMSANYIVGINGEIIECVPPGEIAYASNDMNHLSISIENCHIDDSGLFTQETYDSLVHLTAWLVEEYHLEREDIIRHYDVTGKKCPIYYVEHEDKWEKFRDDVMKYINKCQKNAGKHGKQGGK